MGNQETPDPYFIDAAAKATTAPADATRAPKSCEPRATRLPPGLLRRTTAMAIVRRTFVAPPPPRATPFAARGTAPRR